MEENKMIVEHREIGKLQDSLEVGTPAKSGALKIYGDFSDKEGFKIKIDNALEMRDYMNKKDERLFKDKSVI